MKESGININLLKKDTGRHIITGEIIVFFIITVVLTAGMLGLYIIKINQLDHQQLLNLKLKNEVADYVPLQQNSLLTGELEKQLKAKQRIARDSKMRGVPAAQILSAVEKAMPLEVMATGIEINAEKVLMNGYSRQYYGIAQLIAGLRNNSMFTGVALVFSRYQEDSGQILFTVELTWR